MTKNKKHKQGTHLIAVGGLGIPSLVRVEDDGSWLCVAGIFKGRPISTHKSVVRVCEEGDYFEDIGARILNGKLVTDEHA